MVHNMQISSFEPPHEKTNNVLRRKQRRRSDQQCSNCTADQRLCFRYMDSEILLLKFKPLACFCDCIGWFVLDRVGNSNCWFSHAKAHLIFYEKGNCLHLPSSEPSWVVG